MMTKKPKPELPDCCRGLHKERMALLQTQLFNIDWLKAFQTTNLKRF